MRVHGRAWACLQAGMYAYSLNADDHALPFGEQIIVFAVLIEAIDNEALVLGGQIRFAAFANGGVVLYSHASTDK
jgi:hypothetical protein